MASEEGQAPHTELPSLLAKAVQLGRYKRPEAGIFISFLMSCMNAIQAELLRCLLNTCQGRCSTSGHSARATAVGRMSGRASCLLVFREKPLEERTREQPHLFMSAYKYSQSWSLGSAGPISLEARERHIDTGDGVMLNLWTFLDFKYKEQDLISSKEVC